MISDIYFISENSKWNSEAYLQSLTTNANTHQRRLCVIILWRGILQSLTTNADANVHVARANFGWNYRTTIVPRHRRWDPATWRDFLGFDVRAARAPSPLCIVQEQFDNGDDGLAEDIYSSCYYLVWTTASSTSCFTSSNNRLPVLVFPPTMTTTVQPSFHTGP